MQLPECLRGLETPDNWPLFTVRPVPVPTTAFPPRDELPKTIVVTGHYRGGTSAVAGIVDSLGVPMGHLGRGVYERVFENPDMLSDDPQVVEAMVDSMNHQHDLWGWKNPLPTCFPLPDRVRNPHLVIVFRDPWAIEQMNLEVSNHERALDCLQANFLAIQQHYAALWEHVRELQIPTLAISWERIQISPGIAILGIAAFLGITPTPEQMAEGLTRVAPGGYHVPPSQWLYDLAMASRVNGDHAVAAALRGALATIEECDVSRP